MMPSHFHGLQNNYHKFITHTNPNSSFFEPTSVLDSASSNDSDHLPIPPELAPMPDWDHPAAVSPTHDHSFLTYITGASAVPEFGFNLDQGFAAGEPFLPNFTRSENNTHTFHPSIFNPQPQNPSFIFPNMFGPIPKNPFTDTGQLCNSGGQPIPHHHLQQPGNFHHLQQQAIVDQIHKAAELVHTGNPLPAQAILARLNQQLSVTVTDKPFHRAAFYCKEALQSLLNHTTNDAIFNPINLIFKITAYKSFSEISPLIQFANFTSNQAILESLQGSDEVHIVDFNIGLGGQWASLMQELALRPIGLTSLKITAFTSVSIEHQIELSLARENLIQFATETNIPFEFETMTFDSLSSTTRLHPPTTEAIVVNLPIGSLPPFTIHFIKHLSPRIMVTVDRGCERTDLPFADHIIHALNSYSNLLESLDAVNANTDALQRIERFLVQHELERIAAGRFRASEKMQYWRDLFVSSGLSSVGFSNMAESQAECLIKRIPARGFQVEKKQSSLVLTWQGKELVSVSAWR